MKYIKLIFGALLAISGLIQLIKVIGIYITQPIAQWPIGAELGTIAILIAGIFIFKSGLKHKN